jgi:hypothetical protein
VTNAFVWAGSELAVWRRVSFLQFFPLSLSPHTLSLSKYFGTFRTSLRIMADTEPAPAPAAKGKAAKPKAFDASKFPEPPFFAERLRLWEEAKLTQKAIEEVPIKVTLKDGKEIDAVAGKTTPLEIAKKLSQSLGKKAISASVNGKEWDIWRPLESDSTLEIHTFEDEKGQHTFWHSSAHILGQGRLVSVFIFFTFSHNGIPS